MSHPEVFTHVPEDDQEVVVAENLANSISHDTFNENKFYATG